MRNDTLPTTGLLDRGEHFANSARERLLRAHTTNVHEHHLRGVPEEVIVQRRDLQAVG